MSMHILKRYESSSLIIQNLIVQSAVLAEETGGQISRLNREPVSSPLHTACSACSWQLVMGIYTTPFHTPIFPSP
jgi:hypothetical protein